MSFTFLNQLPTPAQIKEEYPLSKELTELKAKRDAMISDVICGKDDRFLVIIGTCSADNEDSVCDYVSRLTNIQEDVKDRRNHHPSCIYKQAKNNRRGLQRNCLTA